MIPLLPNPFSLPTPSKAAATPTPTPPAQAPSSAGKALTLPVIRQAPDSVILGQGSQQLRLNVPPDFPPATRVTITTAGGEAKPGVPVSITATDGKPLASAVSAMPTAVSSASVEITAGTQRLPAQASLAGQPGTARITVDVFATTPHSAGSASSAPSAKPALPAPIAPPATAATPGANAQPPTGVINPQATGSTASAPRPTTVPTNGMPAQPPAGTAATPRGVSMTVVAKSQDGKATVRTGDVQFRIDRPLAGLRPGDAVRVAPVGPRFDRLAGDDLEQLRGRLAQEIARNHKAADKTQPTLDSKSLLSALLALAEDEADPPQAQRQVSTGTNTPHSAAGTHSENQGPAANNAPQAAAPNRTLDLPVLNNEPGKPPPKLEIHDEPDEEQNRRKGPADSKRLSFSIDFSELGRTDITIEVERGHIHARVATAGVMGAELRRELADVFGAAAELSAKPGRLNLHFARPPEVAV